MKAINSALCGLVVASLLFACDSSNPPRSDAANDTGEDTGKYDADVDTGVPDKGVPDISRDMGRDVSPDIAPDVGPDLDPDMGQDISPDMDTRTYFDQVTLNAAWRAYNDCVQTSGNVANVTTFWWDGVASGVLKRMDNGADTSVTVTMTGENLSEWAPAGMDFDQGTDAQTVFEGIVNVAEVASYLDDTADGHYTATFTGLDPLKKYAVVTTANRQQANYAADGSSPRWSIFEITGADAFDNISSRGATRQSEATVLINTGYNTVNGHVAAWTNIVANDGAFSLVSKNVGTAGPGHAYKFYGLQGLMLVELNP